MFQKKPAVDISPPKQSATTHGGSGVEPALRDVVVFSHPVPSTAVLCVPSETGELLDTSHYPLFGVGPKTPMFDPTNCTWYLSNQAISLKWRLVDCVGILRPRPRSRGLDTYAHPRVRTMPAAVRIMSKASPSHRKRLNEN